MPVVDDSEATILEVLSKGPARSTDVARRLGVSRQAAHARLKGLVDAGKVVREGAARATRYRLPAGPHWERRFAAEGLAEDEVFRLMEREVPALEDLSPPISDVVNYVVTELLNNAIDHASAREVSVAVHRTGAILCIEIADDGVGVFAHVRKQLELPSELVAIQELSKGKVTTAPGRHTGEGLFFVSKAVDVFRLESGSLAWVVDNERNDVAIEALSRPRQGTLARAELDVQRSRDLRELFDEYTEDYEFATTRTVIKLFAIGVRFISRSEAKRLLRGLERFRKVVLDFEGVSSVGQGFVDEVFRVWVQAHPEVTLVPVHMNEAVAFMVQRAQRGAS